MGESKDSKLHLKLVVEKEPHLKYTKILSASKKRDRSTTTIKETKTTLVVEITSKDSIAMRATINSILRDLQVIKSTKLGQ
jgi:tRNA threonylcarbamoyladenosine modification (KEOPS) complex  Pcc1 subunit